MDEELRLCSVPAEIVFKICEYLSLDDILALCSSSRYLADIIRENPVTWKKALFDKWPSMKKAYGDQFRSDWLDQCEGNLRHILLLEAKIKGLSPKYYHRFGEMSFEDFEEFNSDTFPNGNIPRLYVLDWLKMVCDIDPVYDQNDPSEKIGTFTNQHYAEEVYNYLQRSILKNEVSNVFSLVYGTPERVIEFYENWISPLTAYPIKAAIDDICNMTIDTVFLIVDAERRSRFEEAIKNNVWNHTLLADNAWSGAECEYIFKRVAEALQTDTYYLKISHIASNLVSEIPCQKLYPIIFTVIVRRLGIRCDLREPHNRILITWKPVWNSPNVPYFHIDPMTGEKSSRTGCPFQGRENNMTPSSYTPLSLLHSLAATIRQNNDEVNFTNLTLRSMELLHFLHPESNHYLCLLCKMYLTMNKDSSWIERVLFRSSEATLALEPMFNDILEEVEKKKIHDNEIQRQIKLRTADIKFSVGMVGFHKLYRYNCVIFGWDYSCEAPEHWQRKMNVEKLEFGANQPFYKCYASDGTSRYVAQENLVIQKQCRERSAEKLVKYEFSHFNGDFYIPNKEKLSEYPMDVEHSINYFKN